MLARRLGYRFFDLDEEVKREFHTTLEEFVHTENLRWRDQKRGRIIKKILSAENDMSGSLIERLEDLAFFVARNREEAASDKTAIMEGNLFSEAFSFGVRSAVSYRESSARCSS